MVERAPFQTGLPPAAAKASDEAGRADSHRRPLILWLLIIVLVAGLGAIGYGYYLATWHPAGAQKDLYGNWVVPDSKTPPGTKDATVKVGSLAIPAIGLGLPVRYMTSDQLVIDPMDNQSFWIDQSYSPGYPRYDGRIVAAAHSAATDGGRFAAAGNAIQGLGPGIKRWPRPGDTVILNRTHRYVITKTYHEFKKLIGSDPQFNGTDSLVLVSCYRGPGYDKEPATDNFVILTKPAV